MYCSMERTFSLTEQLVDICLSDESDNDSLFRNDKEDDQPKIIADRFLPIHYTLQCLCQSASWGGLWEKKMAETMWTQLFFMTLRCKLIVLTEMEWVYLLLFMYNVLMPDQIIFC